MTAKIIPLFSSPLYTNHLEYNRDKILKFIKSIEYKEEFRREELNDNLGFLTVDKHILDNENFLDLKKNILNEIENFLHRSLIINKPYQIYQSWVTKTPPNCKSNYHTHTSVFSGV